VDHASPLDRPFPWRGATAVLALVAAAELAGLLALAGVRLLPSRHDAAKGATSTPAATRQAPTRRRPVPARPLHPRSRVSVLVLNGNGVTGAAGSEAEGLLARGYRHALAADAPSHGYARSLVLFTPGYRREARRLAGDLRVPTVAPLDGMRGSQLRGSQLVVILGDS
jgi:hypothetical protein